jgi:Ca2+-binding RTX toxin-like protein
MRALVGLATVVALALTAPPALGAEHWEFVGGPLGDAQAGDRGYDTKRIDGVPYVAYTELKGQVAQLKVVRLSGDHWVQVGPVVNADPAQAATRPSLAAGPGNVPWIAWIETNSAGTPTARAARYSTQSNRWVEPVGGDWPLTGKPTHPEYYRYAATLKTEVRFLGGRAHVILRKDGYSEYEVLHLRLSADRRSWEHVPRTHWIAPGDVTSHVGGGGIYVATLNRLQGPTEVSRYDAAGDGEDLPEVGDSLPETRGNSSSYSVFGLAELAGTTYALWGTSALGARVAQFIGGAWQDVAGPVHSGIAQSIRVIGGRLYVVSASDPMWVMRLEADGSGWEEVQGVAGDGAARNGILTGAGGVPYVAFSDVLGPHVIRVQRLDGAPVSGPDDFDDSEEPAAQSDGELPGIPNGEPPPAEPPADGHATPLGPTPTPTPGPCGARLLGTAKRDLLAGDSLANTIRGLAGNDRIFGLGGDDCLYGGGGNDRIAGGEGVDMLSGGAGNDRLIGGAGNDRVKGGAGNDVIDSRGSGHDRIDCGPGRDRALVGDLDTVRNCERVVNAD